MPGKKWYVGCACDHNFVQHASVMLTSLSINGKVPEATILVGGFDLDRRDHEMLRAAAGTVNNDVRIVEITREMLGAVADREWEEHYSLPIFGRLFLPEAIVERGARLLTLDSDMIVNRSVRQLFEMDLIGDYVAAIHDTPRTDDTNYFNSGMMLIDVDGFKKHRVTARALGWLTDQMDRPRWPDQDALNHVVGNQWYRLERTWNLAFCGAPFDPDPVPATFYDTAHIVHFTGQTKPWNDEYHRGRPLYEQYLAEHGERRRMVQAATNYADVNFICTALELFLGRPPGTVLEIGAFRHRLAPEVLRSILHSPEFTAGTLLSIKLNAPFPAATYPDTPSIRHIGFAADRLPLRDAVRMQLAQATSWRSLLMAILSDSFFREVFDLPFVPTPSPARCG